MPHSNLSRAHLLRLSPLHGAAIADVKREAARRIDAVMPVFKQINALRLDPLSHKNCEAFAQIDTIRSASDIIEQDVMDSEAPDAVPINSHPAWPTETKDKVEQR